MRLSCWTRARLTAADEAVALRVASRRSELAGRVAAVLRNDRRGGRSPVWALSAASLTAALTVATSALRLGAADPLPAPPVKAPEGVTFGGVVTEDGGGPVAGATVRVELYDGARPPVGGRYPAVAVLNHTADAAGRFSFTVAPEFARLPELRLFVSVESPDHLARRYHSKLGESREGERVGDRPAFERAVLRRGRPVNGALVRPDGAPAAGVLLLGYSRERHDHGIFAGRSDEQGRFRLVAPPGRATLLAQPDDAATLVVPLADADAVDVGELRLSEGARVVGRVLDEHGRPAAGVGFHLHATTPPGLWGPGSSRPVRSVATAPDGSFRFAPVRPGTYEIHTSAQQPHSALYSPRRFQVTERPDPLEIKALPSVEVRGRYVSPRGEPRPGYWMVVEGWFDGRAVSSSGQPDARGHVAARLPRWALDVSVQVSTDARHAVRWRRGPGQPLSSDERISLDDAKADIGGLEFVVYEAPVVLARVVAADGRPAADAAVSWRRAATSERNALWSGCFEQSDGRFRSRGVPPDEEIVLMVSTARRVRPPTLTLKLAEGETREVTLTLPAAGEK